MMSYRREEELKRVTEIDDMGVLTDSLMHKKVQERARLVQKMLVVDMRPSLATSCLRTHYCVY